MLEVRNIRTTSNIVVSFAGTIRVVLGCDFFSFELTALVSIVIWLFAVAISFF